MENKAVPKRIFIDMDGVLADFAKGISELMGSPLALSLIHI
mgnify:CR=1 FL=1